MERYVYQIASQPAVRDALDAEVRRTQCFKILDQLLVVATRKRTRRFLAGCKCALYDDGVLSPAQERVLGEIRAEVVAANAGGETRRKPEGDA